MVGAKFNYILLWSAGDPEFSIRSIRSVIIS